ncbi:MAG: hypothetical protein KF725_13500 [Cyclobacteriaceae bacterium]|nr:hypothetical protein [Cyclobacteriaceae bacterium]UYN85362.1 MAG: hypothetical protein KIT51_10715 [Cyclobacteriaceae bacterium]
MKQAFYCIILVLLSISTLASDPDRFYSVENNGSGIFTVSYHSRQSDKIKVSIYDSKNRAVFSEVIVNVSTFSRPYNFNGLPYGKYTLVIEDSTGKHEEILEYLVKERGLLRFQKQVPAR